MKDLGKKIATYFSVSFSLLTFIGIILFILIKGLPSFKFSTLFGKYEPEITVVSVEKNDKEFKYTPKENEYFSIKYGVALKEEKNNEGEVVTYITYIDPNSPFKTSNYKNKTETYEIKTKLEIDIIEGIDESGEYQNVSQKDGAKKITETLDKLEKITSMQVIKSGGGALGSLLATIYLILLTLLIAIPIGVLSAIYLSEYTKDNLFKRILESLIEMTASIPSIIFGFVGALILIPFSNNVFHTNGYSLIAGSLTLSLMLLPIIIKTTKEALDLVPNHYTMASLALGASRTRTVFKIKLKGALPGILTSIILCIGRIIGESAALIFVMGTMIKDNITLTGGSTSLATHIWSLMQGENPNYEVACSISLLILIIVLILSILVKLIAKKINKYEV